MNLSTKGSGTISGANGPTACATGRCRSHETKWRGGSTLATLLGACVFILTMAFAPNGVSAQCSITVNWGAVGATDYIDNVTWTLRDGDNNVALSGGPLFAEGASGSEILTGANNGPYTFSWDVDNNTFCDNFATFTVLVNGSPDYTLANTGGNGCGGISGGPIALEGCAAESGSGGGGGPAGCTNTPEGLWPTATFTPACTGSNEVINSGVWTGEYSNVNVSNGTEYTFSSSVGSHFITIMNSTGTSVLAAGPSPLTWTADVTATVRFATHLNSSCGVGSFDDHSRIVSCGTSGGGGPISDPCDISVNVTSGSWGDGTTWTLTDNSGTTVLSGGPYGNGYSDTQTLTGGTAAPYTLTVVSTMGDNSPNFSVTAGGVTVASGNVPGSTTVAESGIECTTGGGADPCDISVNVTSGSWGDGTTWSLTDTFGVPVLSGGTYGNGYNDTQSIVAADGGPYTFTITSTLGDNTPTYTVTVGGIVVANGSVTQDTFTQSDIAPDCGGGTAPPAPEPCDNTTAINACGDAVSTTIAAGAGAFTDFVDCTLSSFALNGGEQIYTFVPSVTGNYTIETTSVTIAANNFLNFLVQEGTCTAPQANWDCLLDVSGPSVSAAFSMTAGATYYFLVKSESTGGASSNWQINCPGPACNDNEITVNMNDSFGDGWNGAEWQFVDFNTSTVVASGTLATGSIGSATACLPDGCYEFVVTAGEYPLEVSWSVAGLSSGAISGGAPFNGLVTAGAGSCPVGGCLDPSACNYNPEADFDDGSCTSGIVPDLEFPVTSQCSGFIFNTGDGAQNSVPPTCDPFVSASWFETWGSFTAPASGELQLYIEVVALSGLVSIEFFDDCGAVNFGCVTVAEGQTIIDIEVDPNETYLIRISSWLSEVSDVFMCFQPVGTAADPTSVDVVNLGGCSAETSSIATITGGNNQAWFEFEAITAGLRIEANGFGSGSADIEIALFEADGVTPVPGALADVTATGGNEALNFGGLTPGESYRCRVSDLSLAAGFDDYSLCFQFLPATQCDYGSGPYSFCNVFKAQWVGPGNYQFTYTNVETGLVDATFTTNGLTTHILRQAEGLQWDTEYQVTTNVILQLADGSGSMESILVENNNGCTIFIDDAPLTKVRNGFGGMDESSAVQYSPFGIVRADFACEANSYTWSFNDGSFLGDGIEYTKFSAGNILPLGLVGLDPGTYAVRVKATFVDGTETPYGDIRYISILQPTGMATEVESPVVMMDNDKVIEDELFTAGIAIYPNPNRGDNFNLNISGIEAGTDRVMLDIYDLYGKLVKSEQLAVGGENLNIVVSLDGIADGMYLVNVIMDGKVYTERMIVQK